MIFILTCPDSKFKNKKKVHKLLLEGEKAMDNDKVNEVKAICNLISVEYINDETDRFDEGKDFFGTGLK